MVLESFRKNQKWLMIVIATLVIISFAWWGSWRNDPERYNADVIGHIYGRPIRLSDIDRVKTTMGLAQQLMLRNLTSQEFLNNDYPWNVMVLAHESNRLGLEPTPTEIADAIKALIPFQTAGSFDSTKYSNFLGENQTIRGVIQKQVENAVRADLQFGRVRQMLAAGAAVSGTEVRALYDEINSKLETQVVRLKLADFAPGITVSDDDVKKYFEDPRNKAALMLDARRKVKYIALSLTDDEKKLPPAERRKALQKIADQMESLSQAMQESGADFNRITAGLGLTDKMKETAEFDRESIAKLPEASLSGFKEAALTLTPERPASDVLQGADTFHFLVLSGYTPARALTLEEARPQIVKALTDERARLALETKSNEIRAQIAQSMKDGKSFADAVTAAGLKAEPFPAFSRIETNHEFPDSNQVMQAAEELAVGAASKPVPTQDGAIIVYLTARVAPDAQKFATSKDTLARNIRQYKQVNATMQWLSGAREAANLRLRQGVRDVAD